MIIETNLVDLSKITLENYVIYNEHLKYEIPRQWGVRHIKAKRNPKTLEERRKAMKNRRNNASIKSK